MRKFAAENILLGMHGMDTPGTVFKFEMRKPL